MRPIFFIHHLPEHRQQQGENWVWLLVVQQKSWDDFPSLSVRSAGQQCLHELSCRLNRRWWKKAAYDALGRRVSLPGRLAVAQLMQASPTQPCLYNSKHTGEKAVIEVQMLSTSLQHF